MGFWKKQISENITLAGKEVKVKELTLGGVVQLQKLIGDKMKGFNAKDYTEYQAMMVLVDRLDSKELFDIFAEGADGIELKNVTILEVSEFVKAVLRVNNFTAIKKNAMQIQEQISGSPTKA